MTAGCGGLAVIVAANWLFPHERPHRATVLSASPALAAPAPAPAPTPGAGSMRYHVMMNAPVSAHDPAGVLALRQWLSISPEQAAQIEGIAVEARRDVAAVLSEEQRARLAQLPEQPTSIAQLHGPMPAPTPATGEPHCPSCAQAEAAPALLQAPAVAAPLPVALQAQMDRLIASYLQAQRSLAADGVPDLAPVREAARALAENGDGPVAREAQIIADGSARPAADLAVIREAFAPLSEAVVSLARLAPPSSDAATALYLAHCPMADAVWLQATDQVGNPYMGPRMLRCGSVRERLQMAAAPATAPR